MQTNDNNTWLQRANQWLNDPSLTSQDRTSLQNLLNDKSRSSYQALEEMFYQELEFGTAGLRGIVDLGSNRMNIYNIRRATQALSLTIKEKFEKNSSNTKFKVVISFDSRLSSEEFSQAAAEVLCANGIETYMFSRPTATPILSFAVRQLQCQAGIMVTASHNPKDYNGYKVYWDDGAQITSPIDKIIMQQYKKITNFASIPLYNKKIHDDWKQVPEELYHQYYLHIEQSCLRPKLCQQSGKNLKIVYTPLHGTGAEPVSKVMQILGFTDFHLVSSQAKPDGHFPTTDYPNPEDPKALMLANELLLKIKADVAIGSDPDTDRMGVIIGSGTTSEFLSGNDIANFLLFYKLETLQEQHKIHTNSLVLKSIVTSNFQDELCAAYNVNIINTLTGFKWMAEILRKQELESKPFNFIFASEESFGSMPNCFVRDKDGVGAAALLCEALLYYKERGISYHQLKLKLAEKFGYFHDVVLNFQFPGIQGMQQIKLLMDKLKNPTIPESFFSKLNSIENYQTSEALNLKTNNSTPLYLPKTSMLGLLFDNKSKIYVRPSGTEPKIKFYLLLQGNKLEKLHQFASDIQLWIHKHVEEIKKLSL